MLVAVNTLDLIAADRQMTARADRLHGFVLDTRIHVFFRMEKDLLLSLFIVKPHLVKSASAQARI
jgi:hypothetical protein